MSITVVPDAPAPVGSTDFTGGWANAAVALDRPYATLSAEVGSPTSCEEMRAWAGNHASYDLGHTTVGLLLQSSQPLAVAVDSVKVTVLSASPPPSGQHLAFCQGPGGASMYVRGLYVDLDASPPRTYYVDDAGEEQKQWEPFQVLPGESVMLYVRAEGMNADYRWLVTIRLVIDGKVAVVSVPDTAKGFRTVGATDPVTVESGGRGTWSPELRALIKSALW